LAASIFINYSIEKVILRNSWYETLFMIETSIAYEFCYGGGTEAIVSIAGLKILILFRQQNRSKTTRTGQLGRPFFLLYVPFYFVWHWLSTTFYPFIYRKVFRATSRAIPLGGGGERRTVAERRGGDTVPPVGG
jgi:hypothetical protein